MKPLLFVVDDWTFLSILGEGEGNPFFFSDYDLICLIKLEWIGNECSRLKWALALLSLDLILRQTKGINPVLKNKESWFCEMGKVLWNEYECWSVVSYTTMIVLVTSWWSHDIWVC